MKSSSMICMVSMVFTFALNSCKARKSDENSSTKDTIDLPPPTSTPQPPVALRKYPPADCSMLKFNSGTIRLNLNSLRIVNDNYIYPGNKLAQLKSSIEVTRGQCNGTIYGYSKALSTSSPQVLAEGTKFVMNSCINRGEGTGSYDSIDLNVTPVVDGEGSIIRINRSAGASLRSISDCAHAFLTDVKVE